MRVRVRVRVRDRERDRVRLRLRLRVEGGGRAVAQLEAFVRLERAREGVAEVHRAEERLLPEVRADALEHRVDLGRGAGRVKGGVRLGAVAGVVV